MERGWWRWWREVVVVEGGGGGGLVVVEGDRLQIASAIMARKAAGL